MSEQQQKQHLPFGWKDRNNQMSEKDMKLGGDAANKFSNIGKNAYSGVDTNGASYKNSDEVKAFYMGKIEQQQQKQDNNNNNETTNIPATTATEILPAGWETRQRFREVEAKQYGVFSRNNNDKNHLLPTVDSSIDQSITTMNVNNGSSSTLTAEASLVHVTTVALDAMAQSLEQKSVPLSSEQRAKFAAAMKRAMTAIAKCR